MENNCTTSSWNSEEEAGFDNHNEKILLEKPSTSTEKETEWEKYMTLSTKELRESGERMSVSAAELQWINYKSIQTKELLNWNKYMPIGYRFNPSDHQLLKYYLLGRVNGAYILPGIIKEIDVYRSHPANLPDLNKGEEEFSYFFTPRDRMYQNGTRLSRTTKDGEGHWKMTSKITPFQDVDNSDLGRRNTLVYHEKDLLDNDVKTNWIMHEYVLDDSLCNPNLQLPSTPNTLQRDIVLCRIYERKQNQEEKKKSRSTIRMRDINEKSAEFCTFGRNHQPKRKLPTIPDLNSKSVDESEWDHQEASLHYWR